MHIKDCLGIILVVIVLGWALYDYNHSYTKVKRKYYFCFDATIEPFVALEPLTESAYEKLSIQHKNNYICKTQLYTHQEMRELYGYKWTL